MLLPSSETKVCTGKRSRSFLWERSNTISLLLASLVLHNDTLAPYRCWVPWEKPGPGLLVARLLQVYRILREHKSGIIEMGKYGAKFRPDVNLLDALSCADANFAEGIFFAGRAFGLLSVPHSIHEQTWDDRGSKGWIVTKSLGAQEKVGLLRNKNVSLPRSPNIRIDVSSPETSGALRTTRAWQAWTWTTLA